MSSDAVIAFERLTKRFPRSVDQGWRFGVPGSTPALAEHAALDEVDLRIEQGEAVGIIGPNGAGKSTLLKVLAGVLEPTSGSVRCNGRIGPMIELGLGFHPALTGRENVRCAAALLGLGRRATANRFDDIVAFSGLEAAIDHPVREYSSGMLARLGFATAVHADPEVLVVDEVLAVGDRQFQERCLQRIDAMVSDGTTLLFVSHEMPLVQAVCHRVVVLRDGRVSDDGPTQRVVDAYLGRRTAPLASSGAGFELGALALQDAVLPPHGRLCFEAVLDVGEPTHADSLQVALSLPTIDPDLVIAEARVPVPVAIDAPGRYRLTARSTPIPLVGGRLRVSCGVLSHAKAALAVQTVDFEMAGPLRTIKPLYDLQPRSALERVEGSVVAEAPRPASDLEDPILRLRGVVKSFPRGDTAVGLAVPGRHRSRAGRVLALDGIDLDLGRGEAVGIIGPNGAGKSTLLRCIARVSEVDAGTVDRRAHIVPMLELGVGLLPDFDGRENLRVMAAFLGADAGAVGSMADEIIGSSGVGSMVDQPVKHWSSGMRARFAFALATTVPAELLLIDEMLAVGDQDFRRRAIDRIAELVDSGVSVLFVSHEMRLVTQVCSRAVRLEAGKVVDDGPVFDVVERYSGVGWSGGSDIGSGPVRVRSLQLDEQQVTTGATATLSATIVVARPAPHVRLELSMRDPSGQGADEPLTIERLELLSIAIEEVATEGALSDPGEYRFSATTGPLLGNGDFHLVLSAVDVRDGAYLSEAWVTLHVGRGRRHGSDLPGAFTFEVDVDAVRVDHRASEATGGQ